MTPSTPNYRLTLPSIQELFSDLEFNKLQLQSAKHTQSTIVTANAVVLPHVTRDSKVFPLHEPPHTPPRSSYSQKALNHSIPRPSPYPDTSTPHPPKSAGEAFGDRLSSKDSRFGRTHGRQSTPHRTLTMMGLPTYVVPRKQCPPGDDRQHACGICHQRFNRPSSLVTHMNSHTGAQPFECPFPGCARRFSVKSNMHRHHRSHLEGTTLTAQTQSLHPSNYRASAPSPHLYYSSRSSPSSSLPSSPAHMDGGR